MDAVNSDGTRAFLFYLTDNDTGVPPLANSNVWGLGDGAQWKRNNKFPVYAIPGADGNEIMEQLALYSGNVTDVPNGHQLAGKYRPSDYIRLAAGIGTSGHNSLPSLWIFLLIVLAVLIFVVGTTSCLMHWVQRKRRQRLRRQVANGEVDLEALGIRRLTVPQEVLDKMPLYIYTDDKELTPPSTGAPENSPSASTTLPPPPSQHYATPFSQPTCAICIDDFEPGSSTVRQLPCGHIFHPDCVDSFLTNNSSLCPLCKKSALPKGYCPTTVTNAMVRRERMARRMRARTAAQGSPEHGATGGSGVAQPPPGEGVATLTAPFGGSRVRRALAAASRRVSSAPTPAPASANGIELLPAASPPVPAVTTHDTVTGTAAVAPSPPLGAASLAPRTLDGTAPTATPPQGQGRREWARQRALAMLARRSPQEERMEEMERRRPGWRKVVGRVWPGLA